MLQPCLSFICNFTLRIICLLCLAISFTSPPVSLSSVVLTSMFRPTCASLSFCVQFFWLPDLSSPVLPLSCCHSVCARPCDFSAGTFDLVVSLWTFNGFSVKTYSWAGKQRTHIRICNFLSWHVHTGFYGLSPANGRNWSISIGEDTDDQKLTESINL